MLAVKLLRLHIISQELVHDLDLDLEMAVSVDNKHETEGSVLIQYTKLGVPCQPITMQSLETRSATDSAFSGIHRKFAEFLDSSVNAWGYNITKYIMISPDFEVCIGFKFKSFISLEHVTRKLTLNHMKTRLLNTDG